jgi:hypothetical protein
MKKLFRMHFFEYVLKNKLEKQLIFKNLVFHILTLVPGKNRPPKTLLTLSIFSIYPDNVSGIAGSNDIVVEML